MRELEKRKPYIFSSFNSFQPDLSLARSTNREFCSTGVTTKYNFIPRLVNIFLVLMMDKHFKVLKWHV